jgi:hypothetical protein
MHPLPHPIVQSLVGTLVDELPEMLLPTTGPLVPLDRVAGSVDVVELFGEFGWLYATLLQQLGQGTLLAAVDFGSLIDFPPWTATAFVYAGLILLVLGMMAWLGSPSLYRRSWGRRLAMSGGGLFVVGTAFGTFVDLLQYVLG